MSYTDYSFLHCFHVLHAILNNHRHTLDQGEQQLLKYMEPAGNLIFVLVDGLGSYFVDRLSPLAFLRKEKIFNMTSVFPSTTACAILSAATGKVPAEHGVPGRWTYVKQIDTHIDTLAFRERFTGNTVTDNLSEEQVWQYPSQLRCTQENNNWENDGCLWIIPKVLMDSPFDAYLCGDCEKFGYSSISEAVNTAISFTASAPQHALSSRRTKKHAASPAKSCLIYLWDFDSLLHEEGTESIHVRELLEKLNTELERLSIETGAGTKVFITADHGQLNSPIEKRFPLYPGDELLTLLETPPFGEPRVPQFLVPEKNVSSFQSLVEKRYSEHFTFHRRKTLETNSMFGPRQKGKSFFGNICGIARHNGTLKYYHEGTSPEQDHLGEHGGMSLQERKIPLILG